MNFRHFDQARQSVDLVGFITTKIGKPTIIGGWHRWDACPACDNDSVGSRRLAVKGNHWTCFVCLNSGSVVDFAAAFWETTPDDAAKRLINSDAPKIERTIPVKPVPSIAEDRVRQELCGQVAHDLKQVICDTPNEEVLNYLENERGIDRRVLVECMKRKIFGCLPSNPQEAFKLLRDVVGEDRLKKSGMWREGSRMPAIAFRPLVFFLHSGGAEFRIIRKAKEDEAKSIRYGLLESPIFWKAKDGVSEVEVVEGGIDLLSRVAMGSARHIIAVPGCNSWRVEWLAKLHARGWADRVVVMLDNDIGSKRNPGQEWAAVMISKLDALGIKAVNASPVSGDVNDMLLKMRNR